MAAQVLRGSGLDPRRWAGLALGLGLDRALMLRKGIRDIRLLRSETRTSWPFSGPAPLPAHVGDPGGGLPGPCKPAEASIRALCWERVPGQPWPRAEWNGLAALEVRAVTAAPELPPAAVERLRLAPGQVNVLLRLVLQPLDQDHSRTGEANLLRDRVYLALHRGQVRPN